MTDKLKVSLYGLNLGYVARDARTGKIYFEYDSEFVQQAPFEPSPLKMPVAGTVYGFPELSRTSFTGVPGMIADSVPDHYGTEVIRTYFLSKGRDPASIGPLDLLAYIGVRGFGALEYHPQEDPGSAEDIDVGVFRLWQESRNVLLPDKSAWPSGMELVYKFGSTAGGARAKAAILYHPHSSRFKVQGLETQVSKGFAPWLLKFDGLAKDDDSRPKPYERMEYVYSLMAKEAGLKVPQTSYFEEENGMFHFLVKRFDRIVRAGAGSDHDTLEKVHMQTLSALGHFDHNDQRVFDYEVYLRFCQALTNDARQVREGYRRLVFNVLAHNFDDHAKNFSFMMDRQGNWTLSPAYDYVFTSSAHQWFSRGHQITINKKALNITLEDLIAVADKAGINRPQEIIEKIRSALSKWRIHAKRHGIEKRFPEYVDEVARGLSAVDIRHA